LVRELAEGQKQIVERLDRLELLVQHLVERMDRFEDVQKSLIERMDGFEDVQKNLIERMDRFEDVQKSLIERMDKFEDVQREILAVQQHLIERMDRFEDVQKNLIERMDRFEEVQKHFMERMDNFDKVQQKLITDVGNLKGLTLEQLYRNHAPAYLGRLLRRARVVDITTLIDDLEKRLKDEEVDELLRTDLVLTGKPAALPEISQIWLVMEVSATVDRGDVERALERANLLRKAGYPAVAVAAGMEVTLGARETADAVGAALLIDGRIEDWQKALNRALMK